METNQEFLDFFVSLDAEEKRDLASKAKTSVAYLSQIANGHRKAGAELIANLTSVDQRITPSLLRPDLYARFA